MLCSQSKIRVCVRKGNSLIVDPIVCWEGQFSLTMFRMCVNKNNSLQGSHGIEKPGKSREFVLVFFPGLEVWNFVENLEISRKVGKIVASAPPKVF